MPHEIKTSLLTFDFFLRLLLLTSSSDFCVWASELKVKVKVTLRLTVSQSVSLGVEPHLGLMTRDLLVWQLRAWFCEAPSLTRGRVCLLYVLLALTSSRLSRVRVSWDSRTYFTVSDLRLPFSSPPTTLRVTVEVFDPASTRVASELTACSWLQLLGGRDSRHRPEGRHFVYFSFKKSLLCNLQFVAVVIGFQQWNRCVTMDSYSWRLGMCLPVRFLETAGSVTILFSLRGSLTIDLRHKNKWLVKSYIGWPMSRWNDTFSWSRNRLLDLKGSFKITISLNMKTSVNIAAYILDRINDRGGSVALTTRHPLSAKVWHQLRRQTAVARSFACGVKATEFSFLCTRTRNLIKWQYTKPYCFLEVKINLSLCLTN
jgi:hypothetical protein